MLGWRHRWRTCIRPALWPSFLLCLVENNIVESLCDRDLIACWASNHLVHGPDRVTVHPPPQDSLRPSFFAPWTSPDIKSRCHQKKLGWTTCFELFLKWPPSFMMISNLKSPFSLHGLHKIISAL